MTSRNSYPSSKPALKSKSQRKSAPAASGGVRKRAIGGKKGKSQTSKTQSSIQSDDSQTNDQDQSLPAFRNHQDEDVDVEGSEHMSQDVTELLTLLQSKKKKQQCEKAKKTEMQYDRILKESLENVEKIVDSGSKTLRTKSNEYLTSAVESLKYQLTQFRMMKEYLDTSLVCDMFPILLLDRQFTLQFRICLLTYLTTKMYTQLHYGAFNEAFEQNMNVLLKEQRNFEAEVGNDVSTLKLDTSQFLKKVQKDTNGVKEKLRTMGEEINHPSAMKNSIKALFGV